MIDNSTVTEGDSDFVQYLQKSRYHTTYQYLVLAQETLRSRKYLLDLPLQKIRESTIGLANISDEDLSHKIKEIHALQFDLIAKSFMLIEDLTYFYKFLKDNPKKLAEAMTSTKRFPRGKVLKEWSHLSKNDVIDVFRFQFSNKHLSERQQTILKGILERQIDLIQKKLSSLSKFWTDYIDVYNGFKHGFTAIPGSVIVNKQPLSLILVRRKKQQRVCTYHIPADAATISYYDVILSNAHSLLKLLIESHALHIQNREGFSIPSLWEDELKLTPIERRVLKRTDKTFRGLFKRYNLIIKIHPPRVADMKKSFAEKHIYCNPKFDMYSMTPRFSISKD